MSRFVVQVVEWKPLDVKESDVLGLTEAGARLGIVPQAVSELCLRGQLRRVLDTSEPNPRKRGRVLLADLERELARRRSPEARDDGRLKRVRRK